MRKAQQSALSGCGCGSELQASFTPKRSLEQQFEALLDDVDGVMTTNPGGTPGGNGDVDDGSTATATEAGMMPILIGGGVAAGLLYLVKQRMSQ